ncbi:hypothetical protein ACIQUG_23405 [Ensifer sp. NPDC090286]|uniref:hypothetical protein n=1 Tax=Ensifer sp. NPDC090286 TaxID=3363991 RepID=UPI00383BBE2F
MDLLERLRVKPPVGRRNNDSFEVGWGGPWPALPAIFAGSRQMAATHNHCAIRRFKFRPLSSSRDEQIDRRRGSWVRGGATLKQ